MLLSRNLFLLIAGVFLAAPAAFAQSYRYFPFLSDTMARKPLGVIKLAPLSLLEPYNTFQAGFEYIPEKGVWSIQAEGGYGNYFTNLHNNQALNGGGNNRQNSENWRFRTEIRLYTEGYIYRPLRFYVAAEYFYRRSNWLSQGSVGRECESGVCAYFEQLNYRMFRDVFGYHAKVGVQQTLSPRLLLDLYAGLGRRHVWVHSPQLGPNDDTRRRRVIFNIDPGQPGYYRLVSASMGFKLGYLLYRKELSDSK